MKCQILHIIRHCNRGCDEESVGIANRLQMVGRVPLFAIFVGGTNTGARVVMRKIAHLPTYIVRAEVGERVNPRKGIDRLAVVNRDMGVGD